MHAKCENHCLKAPLHESLFQSAVLLSHGLTIVASDRRKKGNAEGMMLGEGGIGL